MYYYLYMEISNLLLLAIICCSYSLKGFHVCQLVWLWWSKHSSWRIEFRLLQVFISLWGKRASICNVMNVQHKVMLYLNFWRTYVSGSQETRRDFHSLEVREKSVKPCTLKFMRSPVPRKIVRLICSLAPTLSLH